MYSFSNSMYFLSFYWKSYSLKNQAYTVRVHVSIYDSGGLCSPPRPSASVSHLRELLEKSK